MYLLNPLVLTIFAIIHPLLEASLKAGCDLIKHARLAEAEATEFRRTSTRALEAENRLA
jgi:hypothetical protein